MPKDYAKKSTRRRLYQHQVTTKRVRKIKWSFVISFGGGIALLLLIIFTYHPLMSWLQKSKNLVNVALLKAKNASKKPPKTESFPPSKPVLPDFTFYRVLPDNKLGDLPQPVKRNLSKNWPYLIQIAALTEKKQVAVLREKLGLLGFDLVVIHRPKSKFPFRVCSGPYPNLEEAKMDKKRLEENAFEGFIMNRYQHK